MTTLTYTQYNCLKDLNKYLYINFKDKFSDYLPLNDESVTESLQLALLKHADKQAYDLFCDVKGEVGTENAKVYYSKEVFFNQVLLNTKLSSGTHKVAHLLEEYDSTACMVGGCVRDTLLGKVPKDFDFVTSLPYEQLKNMFEFHGYKTGEVGKHFLVLNVYVDGEVIDVANFRKDGTYEDGRRPESVDVGTLLEDAQRRDFTVNALYFRLLDKQVIDPTGQGIDDLINKTLRFVGRPEERIREDYLRIWRAFRFIKEKGLTPTALTDRALGRMFEEAYKNSDPSRVLQEMRKFL